MKITKTFFEDIRKLIVDARTTVARGVDLVQVYTNFEIGRRIVEQEQKGKDRAAYGQEVIKALADRLTDEFGTGFSKRNLELMRRFFLVYVDRPTPIAQTPSAQLPTRKKAQTPSGQFVSDKKSQTATGELAKSKILQSMTAKLPTDEIGQAPSDQLALGKKGPIA